MTKNPINRGIDYEKNKASEHRAKHIGGPGNPDFIRGNMIGEVKCRQTPVTKPELQRLINGDKKVNYVDSKGGFTQPAIDYRDRYHPDVTLESKGKRL